MKLDASQAPPPARHHWKRAQEFVRRGDWARATQALHSAERLAPSFAVFPLHRARALLRSGRALEAIEAARRAQALDPGAAEATWVQASALESLQRHDEVASLLLALPAAQRQERELHTLLALALMRTGRYGDAVPVFLQALALKPDDAPAHHHLGLCLRELGLRREAIECFRTVLALGAGPAEPCARALAAFDRRGLCDWSDDDTQIDALRASALAWAPGTVLRTEPFVYATLVDDPRAQLAAAAACARAIAATVRPLPPREPLVRDRLRVGYVSSDFREHATMHLMIELLEQHDRGRCAVTLYSHAIDDGSPMRRRVEAACERFVDARALSDDELACRVRDDGIDILVDLKGYTRDNRFEMFARRPAPVQASWLGFPGTTGAAFIDYLIGDPVVTPIALAEHYSEKIAQLPGCYQPNDRRRARPPAPPRADCGLADGALVLACFNQPYKISPPVYDVWCALLRELPGAVLWLLDTGAAERDALQREAASRGVAADRLVWAPRVEPADHLARLRHADLFLDTWPCNAHTTASDALWAGVPVVTLPGTTFASRVAASLLHAVGLPELACGSVEAYAQTVLALARDGDRRATLRDRLERARAEAPLFDSAARTRDLERLYERMWAARLSGAPLPHLPASAG